jgi:hypothetical protein
MSDLELRKVLRRWYIEETEEARDNVVHVAARHGMDIWDVFLYVVDAKDLYTAREYMSRKDLDRVFGLLGDLIAPLEQNSSAEVALYPPNEEPIYGRRHHIGYVDYENQGEAYIITEEGVVFQTEYIPHENIVEIIDPEIVKNIRTQRAQDIFIDFSRTWLANEMSDGDSDLRFIYLLHIGYNGGVIDDPTIYQGVPFWDVGHNSTHTFFLGLKDGQRYRMSEYYDHEANDGQGETEVTMEPVDEFGSYFGHY